MNGIFAACPACGGGLYASQLSCSACDTVIQGRFALSAFDGLSADSLGFLESFVRKRGNLKEMERELGASYQELRKRLNAIIGEMGFEAGAEEEIEADLSDRRRAILEQLDRGELDANGAAEALSKTKE
ncbi:MAG: DUF2089 domain-containing protein [Candidatus Latescibacterota bacterium]|nr:DUF2089 domain-containing protein [Candidatus Latescibacterota bacterium]MEE2725637.1 DUF2089 domain-containing protein [Candidatus Latescibacterota bacterium]